MKSWQSDPRLGDYLRKRLLRIVPGYLVAVALSLVVIGSLAPGVPHFFSEMLHRPWNWKFAITTITLDTPWTPPVLPGLPYPAVNTPLWTLSYEVRCYLLTAIFGLIGLYRWRLAWLAGTFGLFLSFVYRDEVSPYLWHHLYWLIGRPGTLSRLFFAFFVGGCFYLYRSSIPFKPWLAWLALFCLCLSFSLKRSPEISLILCGGYLLFYSGQYRIANKGKVRRMPDISYGMYIYGWPIQELLIWYLHPGIWTLFFLSLTGTVLLGLLSWHVVERPMLKLKPHPSVPLPAA